MVTGHMVSIRLDYAIHVTENIKVGMNGIQESILTTGSGVQLIQDMTSQVLMVVMD